MEDGGCVCGIKAAETDSMTAKAVAIIETAAA